METAKRINRLISIDLMRGYFLLVIVIDHFGRFPNMLEWVSGRGALWVTAAEGFFFVSGLMLGLTAVRKIADRGLWPVAKKMWQRAALLYGLSVALTLIFTYIGFRIGWAPKGGLIESHDWATIIWQTITLQYAYGWADFLPRYALFMAVAPLAAYLLYRGLWWVVLWVSMLVWAFVGPSNFTLAWQILFFLGMISGYYLPQLMNWAESWSAATRQTAYRSAIIASLTALSLSVVFCLVPFILNDYSRLVDPIFNQFSSLAAKQQLNLWLSSTNQVIGGWFDHERVGVARILLFGLYFWTAFAVLQKHSTWATKRLGWLLIPLGKNSLLTYLVHASVIFALDIYVLRQPGIKWNFIHTILAIALVWSLVVIISQRATITAWLARQLGSRHLGHQAMASVRSLSNYAKLQVGSISKIVAVIVPLVAILALTMVMVLRLLD